MTCSHCGWDLTEAGSLSVELPGSERSEVPARLYPDGEVEFDLTEDEWKALPPGTFAVTCGNCGNDITQVTLQ